MQLDIIRTDLVYNEILKADHANRVGIFEGKILAPFKPMFAQMGMQIGLDQFGSLSLDKSEAIEQMLSQLKSVDIWQASEEALRMCESDFEAVGLRCPEAIRVGIILGDSMSLQQSQGYSGIGSIPGYIILMVAPNSENLPKLTSCLTHEYHHNVLFNNLKWSFMHVSVSQYLAIEGLAESYAEACFGEAFIGPWVTGVAAKDLEITKAIIKDALDVKGLMETRKYIFGDHPMLGEDERTGMPYCGGYAVGYHSVQLYMKQHNRSVVEATKDFVDGVDIVKDSGYFG